MSIDPHNLDHLVAFVLNESDANAAHTMQSAIEADPPLAMRVSRLRQIVKLLGEPPSPAPSPALIAQVKAMLRETARADAGSVGDAVAGLGNVIEWIARCVFDSRGTPALAGFRGASEEMHLMFESEVGGLDLQIRPSRGGGRTGVVRLLGQVETDQRPETAELRDDNGVVCARSDVDRHGMFAFDASPGVYDVHIKLERGVLKATSINLP